MQWPWIVAMLTTAVLVQGQPQYEVQVRGPVGFEYRPGQENRLANGRCCSITEQGTSCLTSCNNSIILCFREMQHPESDTNSVVCSLGRMVFTPPTMNTDIITLNATSAATTTTYPGSLQLLYSIVVTPGGNEVESDQAFLIRAIQNRTSPLTTQSFGGERIVLSTGGIRVVCKEGYFFPDCICIPQNDSTGHFTCDEDGTIVCLPGYQNTATNCVEEEGATPELEINPTDSPSTTTISTVTVETLTTNVQTKALTTESPPTIIIKATTIVSAPATSNVAVNTANDYTTVSVSENSADIVPIVAGGVAGGLVVLLLILIVNTVLVIVVIKVKYMKHYQSNKQESHTEEDIAMRANPVYEIKRFGQSKPGEQKDCYETVQ